MGSIKLNPYLFQKLNEITDGRAEVIIRDASVDSLEDLAKGEKSFNMHLLRYIKNEFSFSVLHEYFKGYKHEYAEKPFSYLVAIERNIHTTKPVSLYEKWFSQERFNFYHSFEDRCEAASL